MTTNSIHPYSVTGILINPNNDAKGVAGSANTRSKTKAVAADRYLPGMLLKKGSLVRTTNTIRMADMTDSMNHPV